MDKEQVKNLKKSANYDNIKHTSMGNIYSDPKDILNSSPFKRQSRELRNSSIGKPLKNNAD